jgi:hypothetical protein
VLGEGFALYRVAARGLIPLGAYRPEQELFTSTTNYVALRP